MTKWTFELLGFQHLQLKLAQGCLSRSRLVLSCFGIEPSESQPGSLDWGMRKTSRPCLTGRPLRRPNQHDRNPKLNRLYSATNITTAMTLQ